MFLTLIGCPISWHKNALGAFNQWLGYDVDINKGLAFIPEIKRKLICPLLDKIIKGDMFDKLSLSSALGRFQWMIRAYPIATPFLQPLWAWHQVVQHSSRPGALVRFLGVLLKKFLDMENIPIFRDKELTMAYGASDAGACDEYATIAGWFSAEPYPDKDMVQWFAYRLTEAEAPWLFTVNSSAKRKVSAAELLGTITLVKAMHQSLGESQVNVRLSLKTDNMGNAFATSKSRSKKWPNAALLMELSSIQYVTGIRATVEHVKRDFNVWADQLTHLDFAGFDIKKRWLPMWKDVPSWILFDKLIPLHKIISGSSDSVS
jgi:hypothetical protein